MYSSFTTVENFSASGRICATP